MRVADRRPPAPGVPSPRRRDHAPNPGSFGLHRSLGFGRIGEFEAIGWKSDAWHGVEFWGLELSPARPRPGPGHPDRRAGRDARARGRARGPRRGLTVISGTRHRPCVRRRPAPAGTSGTTAAAAAIQNRHAVTSHALDRALPRAPGEAVLGAGGRREQPDRREQQARSTAGCGTSVERPAGRAARSRRARPPDRPATTPAERRAQDRRRELPRERRVGWTGPSGASIPAT